MKSDITPTGLALYPESTEEQKMMELWIKKVYDQVGDESYNILIDNVEYNDSTNLPEEVILSL